MGFFIAINMIYININIFYMINKNIQTKKYIYKKIIFILSDATFV